MPCGGAKHVSSIGLIAWHVFPFCVCVHMHVGGRVGPLLHVHMHDCIGVGLHPATSLDFCRGIKTKYFP